MPASNATAVFAAGCFWGVEHAFRKHWPQLSSVAVGYASSVLDDADANQATYTNVCTGTTPFAEAVSITYDPSIVSYSDLLDFFYRIHDPTTVDAQGPDKGSQYRSAVFTTSQDQINDAQSVKARYDNHYMKKSGVPTVTLIQPLAVFHNAEEYHQLYLDKNPTGYACPTHFLREKAE